MPLKCSLNTLQKAWYNHGLELKSVSMDKTPGNYRCGFDTKQMAAEKEFKGSEGKQYNFATGSSRNKTVCLCLKEC